jgi:hypothetical protein
MSQPAIINIDIPEKKNTFFSYSSLTKMSSKVVVYPPVADIVVAV